MASIAPLGCLPGKKPPKEAHAKPKRDIRFEDEKVAIGTLSNLHPHEHTAQGQAPLQYANAPDEAHMPLDRVSAHFEALSGVNEFSRLPAAYRN